MSLRYGCVLRLEGFFDLLAAHLEQCEIRAVIIFVETFGYSCQRGGLARHVTHFRVTFSGCNGQEMRDFNSRKTLRKNA